MSVDILALKVGFSVDSLKAAEAGQRRLYADELQSAATALHVPVSDCYEGIQGDLR